MPAPDELAAEARRWLVGHYGTTTPAVRRVREALERYYADLVVVDGILSFWRRRQFKVGDRVRINYGPGTVVALIPDAAGRGRPPLVVVHADIGQAWLRDPAVVEHLEGQG